MEELIEFLKELRRDITQEQLQGPSSEEQVFTEIVTRHMTEIGMTYEPYLCDFTGRVGQARLKLSGYSLSEDNDALDLYVSIYNGMNEIERIPDSETKRAAMQCSKFLTKCADGTLKGLMDPTHEAYPMVLTIEKIYENLDQIRIYILTDKQARTKNFNSRVIQGKNIRLEVIDIERLFNHLQAGRPRDEIIADMEQICGGSLPCIWIPGEMSEYDYALTAIPGKALHFLYDRYGARILEANVRSFLMQTGKVNKGIRDTMREQPGRFMAYNNGIVIVADEIGIAKTSDGSPGISWLKGLQIVNGGQTAASMYFTKRKFPLTVLTDVRVAAKIIVLNNMARDQEETLITNISRFANSQNTVRQSDFWSNKPFHVELEKFSETTYCPDGTSRWFYERSTGSYKVMLEREGRTPAGIRNLKTLIPSSRKITKTELAKYECAWLQHPDIVSKGAQKNFVEYMTMISDDNIGEAELPNIEIYRNFVSKAIIFRRIHKMILREKIKFPAFQANITAYTVSVLAKLYGERINLGMIWREQDVSEEFLPLAVSIADVVYDILQQSSQGRMISEWAKKEECWETVSAYDFSFQTDGIREI